MCRHPGQLVEELRAVDVEPTEVDGFGHFWIAFGECLAAFGQHGAHQLATRGGEFCGGLVEDCHAFGERSAMPTAGIGFGDFSRVVDVGVGCLAIAGNDYLWPRWVERIANATVVGYFRAGDDEWDFTRLRTVTVLPV